MRCRYWMWKRRPSLLISVLFSKYFDDDDGDEDFVNGVDNEDFVNGVDEEDNNDDDGDNMAVLGRSEEQQTTLLVGSRARLKAI